VACLDLVQVREIDTLIGQPVLAQERPPSAETQGLLEEASRKQQILKAEVESLRSSVDGNLDSRSDEAMQATARALEGGLRLTSMHATMFRQSETLYELQARGVYMRFVP
jgi:hypothetical protein